VFALSPDAFGNGVVTRVIGNPVRSEIASLRRRRSASRSAAADPLLVFGGSLGAARLNTVLHTRWRGSPAASTSTYAISRRALVDSARRAYRGGGGGRARHALHRGHGGEYGWADLVICRAGALSPGPSWPRPPGVGAILVPPAIAVR